MTTGRLLINRFLTPNVFWLDYFEVLFDQLFKTIEIYVHPLEKFKTAVAPGEEGSYKLSKFFSKLIEITYQCSVRGNRSTGIPKLRAVAQVSLGIGRFINSIPFGTRRPTTSTQIAGVAAVQRESSRNRRETRRDSINVTEQGFLVNSPERSKPQTPYAQEMKRLDPNRRPDDPRYTKFRKQKSSRAL